MAGQNSNCRYGLDRMKLDLAFFLAGGPRVNRDFSRYDDQLNYYVQKIFELPQSMYDLEGISIREEKAHRKAAYIMFPGEPQRVEKRMMLNRNFASCVLIRRIAELDSYSDATSYDALLNWFTQNYAQEKNSVTQDLLEECRKFLTHYLQDFNAQDYKKLCTLVKNFSAPLNKIIKLTEDCIFSQTVFNTGKTEKVSAGAKKAMQISAAPKSAFDALCAKLNIAQNKITAFKLTLDALIESQLAKSDYIDYFESLQDDWVKTFPGYTYCDEVETYVRDEKKVCLVSYGNRLGTVKNEKLLFDLLANVVVKLALSDGANDPESLERGIEKYTGTISKEVFRDFLAANFKKVTNDYSLSSRENFQESFRAALIPFKKNLMFVQDLILDEFNFRNEKNSAPAKAEEVSVEALEKLRREYEIQLADKDKQIQDLEDDLSYYENLKTREGFRNNATQEYKGLTDLFKLMCDHRYGAPLNELYLMACGAKNFGSDEIKTVMKNFQFVFSGKGIEIFDAEKIGTEVEFDADESGRIYSTDEKKLREGKNTGVIKYPGWAYKSDKIVLPRVTLKN